VPTAAVVVIGNEILTGKYRDENGPYLVDRLRALGCDLVRIATVRDDVAEIADEVRRCAAACDFVLTSGGVGPTHDDVTLEGVAVAFGLPLEVHPTLLGLLRRYGVPEDAANLRMASVPAGTVLEDTAGLAFPVVVVRNVWVFPGIPKLLREKFENVAARFAGQAVSTARIYTDERESDIAVRLTAVAARHPAVAIGSYPRFGEGPWRVVLTLESRDANALRRAHDDLVATVRVVRAEPPAGA
jgi:molybdenum cofactor synthesis domain-containing protein